MSDLQGKSLPSATSGELLMVSTSKGTGVFMIMCPLTADSMAMTATRKVLEGILLGFDVVEECVDVGPEGSERSFVPDEETELLSSVRDCDRPGRW